MVQLETRNQIVSALVAIMLFAQLLAFGAVGGFPAAFFAFTEIFVCLAVIGLLAKGTADRFWVEMGPILLLFLAAMAWAGTPLVLAMFPALPHAPLLAPDATRLELLKLAGVGALGLTGGLIGLSRSRLQHFIINVAMIGLAYTLLALWVGQVSPLTVWGQPKGAHAYRFTGTFLNANAAGCVFGMIGLLSLGLLQSLLKRTDLRAARLMSLLWLMLTACAAVAAFGACVLTQSRTSLVLAAVLGVTVVVIEAKRGAKRTTGRAIRSRFIMAGAVLILLLSLGLGATQVSSRWSTVLIDAQLRGEAYVHYLGAVGRSPWFGYGLGGFRMLHESILTPSLAPAMWDFGAAHSAVTQAALEGGLPFLLLLAGAVGMIVVRIVKVGANRYRRGAVVTGVIAAVVLAFAFSFVDIALNVPAIAALAVVLLGIAWGDALARSLPAPATPSGDGVGSVDHRMSGSDWARG